MNEGITFFFNSLQESLGSHIVSVLGAVAVLGLGWLAAVIVRAALSRVLKGVRLNERLNSSTNAELDLEKPIALIGFWLVLLMAIIAVFNVLDIQSAAAPFSGMIEKIMSYLPRLFAGGVLLFVAWLVATLVRGLITKVLESTTLDDKLSAEAGMAPMSRNLAEVAFWLVVLLFLPAVLGAFQLNGLLEPIQGMMDKILGMLPNIFAAGMIGFVGWIVAKVVRGLVVNLLKATGIDQFGKSSSNASISSLMGTLAFVFIFIPSLIAALDVLQIEAIAQPATQMLNLFMLAVPNIIGAAIILAVAWYVARFVSGLLVQLLEGVGADSLPEKLGMQSAFSGTTPSKLVGGIFVFFIMLFATAEAASRIGFSQVRDIVSHFIEFGGDVLLGGVIMLVGFWLANLVYTALSRASSTILANIARFAIFGLVLAMGLRAMGLADDIVNLAFGLVVGAMAVAFGLAFGLGGREAAGKQLEHWFAKLRGEK